jgi:hypothetical protein
MKLIKQANGKTTVKMSKRQWLDMGKKAGWLNKEAIPMTYREMQKRRELGHLYRYYTMNIDELSVEKKALESALENPIDEEHRKTALESLEYVNKQIQTITDHRKEFNQGGGQG